jgi:glycosyltransferase involved in cell wall biosynthesis
MSPRLLIVHSSAELYGSDRSLLDFVRLGAADFETTVLLPEEGPLVSLLREAGARVEIGEVCKVQRQMLGARGLLRTMASAWRALRQIRKLADGRPFDIVYTNTVAVFAGALYALAARRPHVWHIREILNGSPRLSAIFRALVSFLSQRIVCNSKQTLEWIALPRSRSRCRVVWNGVGTARPPGRREAERALRGWNDDSVVFALVGRLNAWKGQGLALQAFERLCADSRYADARLWMVGSAFAGQEHFEQGLRERIEASEVRDAVRLEPFRPDVEAVWEAADVVLVPSTQPEPFGRVAIEAMAFGRPVIAASHGGLLDIITDGDSGVLVPPGDTAALTTAMARLAASPELRERLGAQALVRQRQFFSVESYAQAVRGQLLEALGVYEGELPARSADPSSSRTSTHPQS